MKIKSSINTPEIHSKAKSSDKIDFIRYNLYIKLQWGMNMSYRINGLSTSFGGVSWEKCVTEKDRIRYLFLYLESKRILTNPISMEIIDECIASVLEIKNTLITITYDMVFSKENLNCIRKMVKACNDYLDRTTELNLPHIIYKENDRWENLNFDKVMKDFRKNFRLEISNIENNSHLVFEGRISDKW